LSIVLFVLEKRKTNKMKWKIIDEFQKISTCLYNLIQLHYKHILFAFQIGNKSCIKRVELRKY